MADDPELDASDIDVMVAADGVVTLQGTVPDRRSKRLAEHIADSVSGVRDVHNQLRLAGGTGTRELPRRAA
jgi:osmotically-inducible protein OsmY